MKKRFKSKSRFTNFVRKPLIILISLVLIYIFANLILKIKLNIDDQTLVYYILDEPNHYLKHNKNNRHKLDLLINTIYGIDIKSPITFLQVTSPYIRMQEKTEMVYNDNYQNDLKPVTKINNDSPTVYIYNTHPTETFKNTELNIYNFDPTIRSMSNILKDKLIELGVNVIVETADIPKFLKEHNYDYNQSYTASWYYLEKVYNSNHNIDLYIDLHRDGIDYEYSVTTINDKKYAKIMFVVGLNHDNYKSSMNASNGINNYLTKNYPSITRGIYTSPGNTFNQNFTDNMVLIELGGNNNELTEVLNSVDVLAPAIKEYLYEDR